MNIFKRMLQKEFNTGEHFPSSLLEAGKTALKTACCRAEFTETTSDSKFPVCPSCNKNTVWTRE